MQTFNKKDIQLAWCAGIIDGEGTITLTANKGGKKLSNIVPRVLFTMTHKKSVEEFGKIMKIGKVRRKKRDKIYHKYRYYWQTGGRTAVKIAEILLPYLITKKKQAELIIHYKNKCMVEKGVTFIIPEIQRKRRYYVKRIRKLNKKGV